MSPKKHAPSAKGGAGRDHVRILLAEIGPAHGIKGEVTLKSYAGTPEGLMAYGALEEEGGPRTFSIMAVRATAKTLIARIEGIIDRNAAEALRGVKLYVRRARLPEPEAGAYYHEDLIGLAVVTCAGETVGIVTGVHNFGAGDLIEVAPAAGGPSELLPFTAEIVREVDLGVGRITVAMPVYAAEDDDSEAR